MNTFNENFRSSVMESLNELEMGQKKLNSAENAALFTLYYSQAATIDAVINQEAAKKEQDVREKIKTAAVNNNNEYVNLLKSADQASQYLKQSVTNAAVGASNVQIAANAIVRLAGDMGNIMNIIKASDFGSEIHPFALDANEKISETAYEAGLASQFAMESSILTSKVSGDSVLANAKVANDGVNNLLKVVSSDYDAISVTVQTDNTELATISAVEKIAEGVYEDIRIVRNANNMALLKTIGQLNLNLQAYPKKGSEDSAFEVKFNLLKSPFLDKKDEKDEKKSISFYPVSDYYLFVVKEKNKSAFSISKAEDIVNRSTDKNNVGSLTDNNDKAYICLNRDGKTKPNEDAFDVFYTYAQIPDNVPSGKPYHLLDTDGQPVKTGENYVVFLMATFEQAYKKKLNTFDDFLSAPSLPFCLTTHLATPIIISADEIKKSKEKPEKVIVTKIENSKTNSVVTFYTRELPKLLDKTEFRCIYLPVSETHTNEMTNHAEFKKLDSDIKKLTESSKEISELTKELKDNELNLKRLQKDHSKAFKSFEDHVYQEKTYEGIKKLYLMSDKDLEALVNKIYPNQAPKEEKTELTGLLKNVITDLYLTSKLNEIKADIKADEESFSLKHNSNIDFVFNQKIAEQVSAGNYTLVDPKKYLVTKNEEIKELTDIIFPKKESLDVKHLADLHFFKVKVNGTKNTTDNFGNPLINGKRYIPVILAVSTEDETELAKFTNAWTDYQGYNSFQLI